MEHYFSVLTHKLLIVNLIKEVDSQTNKDGPTDLS